MLILYNILKKCKKTETFLEIKVYKENDETNLLIYFLNWKLNSSILICNEKEE